MTLPAVELSKDAARDEADGFLTRTEGMSPTGQRLILAAMLQRIYQEGVTAGHDRAAAIVKGLR